MNLLEIADSFALEGKAVSVEPYGEGHINDTFLVTTDEKRYILQRMNGKLFKNADELMSNVCAVTEYIAAKKSGGETMRVIRTRGGDSYLKADGENAGNYRVYNFLENTVCYQSADSPEVFKSSARAFGDFYKLLDGFDAEKLYDVIPHFHDTPVRFEAFEAAVKADAVGRAATCKKEIEFVLARKDYCGRAVNAIASGGLPLRVTHNDTKLNNVLFDVNTGDGVVIDLDTIMKGTLLYDFGDSIRFGASTAAEDERDLNKVNFSPELFTAYAEGFLERTGGFITEVEKEMLGFSGILMTYECGMRFLTDYLSGDTYFKIHREGHNLDRARTQFKLISDMEKQLGEMNAAVARIGK